MKRWENGKLYFSSIAYCPEEGGHYAQFIALYDIHLSLPLKQNMHSTDRYRVMGEKGQKLTNLYEEENH